MCNNTKRRFEALGDNVPNAVKDRAVLIDEEVEFLKSKPHCIEYMSGMYGVLLNACDGQFKMIEGAMRND